MYYGLKETEEHMDLNDASLFIGNLCIVFGLVVINHNTVLKLMNIWDHKSERIKRVIKYLYVSPFVFLIPLYIGLDDTIEHPGLTLRKSFAYVDIYKPELLLLVIFTNIFATWSDVQLLRKVRQSFDNASEYNLNQKAKNSTTPKHYVELFGTYSIIWILIIFDIVLIVFAFLNMPAFDSAVTLQTVSFRVAANLKFGNTLQKIYGIESTSKKNLSKNDIKGKSSKGLQSGGEVRSSAGLPNSSTNQVMVVA
jgi:hypothetical protein